LDPKISFIRIKVYNALALPHLLYGSGTWTLKKNDKKIDVNQMKVLRRIAWYILFDHKRDDEILEELKVEPVDEKLRRYIKLATICNKK